MAEIILDPGNEARILNEAEVDEVIIPSGTRGENDLLLNFRTVDRVDISAIPDTVEDILENAVDIPDDGAVRLSGTFGQLTLVGINRSQLTAEIFIKTPPEVNDDTITTIAGEAAPIPVLENDVAANGLLEIVGFSASSANGGTIALDDNDTPDDSSDDFLVYSPAEGFTGTDGFTYTVSNGLNATGTGTVTVSVVPENQPPIAEDDFAGTTEGMTVAIAVLSNDSDPEEDPLSIVGFAETSEEAGTVSSGDDGALVYSPAAEFTGTDSFSYTISDDRGGTASATVTVTVAEGNLPPIAEDDFAGTTEGMTVAIAVLSNDSDPEEDPLSIVGFAETSEEAGTVSSGDDGALVYSPAAEFTGTDSFSYTISDGQGGTASATVTVTVAEGNLPPIALDDTALTSVGIAATIAVLDNDSDPDDGPEPLFISEFQDVADNGTITSDGLNLVYTPDDGFAGLDTFSYRVSDGLDTDTATVTVTVEANQPPIAVDDTALTTEGSPATIAVLENDSDADGDEISLVDFATTTENGGTITINNSGSPFDPTDDALVYEAAVDFTGTDSFTYTISDGLATATATVTVTVEQGNRPPIAVDDLAETTAGNSVTIGVLDNDSDPDGDSISLPINSFAQTTDNGGTITRDTNGTPGDGTDDALVYTASADFTGTDSFAYSISDGRGGTASAIVTVTVAEGNIPPIATDDATIATEGIATPIAVLLNDFDLDGDPLSIAGVPATTGLGATIGIDENGTPDDTADDVLVYELAELSEMVTDSFTYSISDGLATDTAMVTVTVVPGNDQPVAVDDATIATEGVATRIAVLDNDSDPDDGPEALSITGSSETAEGGMVVIEDSMVVYTPPEVSGTITDSFTYTISDGDLTDTATVTVTVEANEPPIAVDDTTLTTEGTAATIAVLDNDSDPDGDAISIVDFATTTEQLGTITISDQTDEALVYEAAADFTGTDSFTYTISDGLLTATATVMVTVVSDNDPPVAVDDSLTATEGIASSLMVLDNDFDPNGDAVSLVGLPATTEEGGTIALDRNGTFLDATDDFLAYTSADDGFTGTDSFTYTISDGDLTSTATVTVTVEPSGPVVPPIAADDAAATTVDIPATIAVLANDSDPDGNIPLSIIDVGNPDNGTASIDGDRVIYTPEASFTGINSFTYTMADARGNTDTAEVTVTVVPEGNIAPTAVNDTATTAEDVAVTIAVLANDEDLNGDDLSVTGVAQGANGSASITTGGEVIYTPDADFSGIDSFTYTISDGELTDLAMVTVTVEPVNDAPIAVDDTATAMEGIPEAIAVLENDSDADGDPLEITGLSGTTAGGTVSIDGETVVYTPGVIDAEVTDSFTYTISDGGLTDTATVTVTVTPDNLPPIAVDDTATATEGTPETIAVLANDSDPENAPLTIEGVETTTNEGGTVSINGETVVYTPPAVDAGETLTDSFTYTISDGSLTEEATVTVTVDAENEPPIAVDDVTVTTEGIAATIAVLDNDSDPDNGPEALSITGVSGTAAGGTLTLDGDLAIYTPGEVDALVTDSFTYTISDGELTSTATVTVTVEPNEAPIAVDDVTVTTEGIAATIAVLDNDSDPDNGPEALSITGVSGTAAGGTVTLDGDLAIYTPGEVDALVTDSFTYTITDGELTDTATVTVTVEPDNQLPIAVDDEATTTQNIPVTITVLDNDSDPDGDPLEITAVTDPVDGTAIIDDNGTPDAPMDDQIVYTPDAGFNGTDDFTYSISDGQGGTASATVTVTVEANQPPIAVDDAGIVAAGATINIPVLENDSDPDGDVLTIDGATEPTDGTASIDGALVSYTPDSGFTGNDSFTYTISDTAGETAISVVNISVQPAGDVTGTDGDDQIVGNDLLSTDPGVTRERIDGLAGDDTITGARGADILSGGEGADTFVYQSLADSGADSAAPNEGGDDILDFNPAEDFIQLNFEVPPGTPVTPGDVQINLDFIASGVAIIALSGTNDGDFLPENFAIRLSNLDPTTTSEQIENALRF